MTFQDHLILVQTPPRQALLFANFYFPSFPALPHHTADTVWFNYTVVISTTVYIYSIGINSIAFLLCCTGEPPQVSPIKQSFRSADVVSYDAVRIPGALAGKLRDSNRWRESPTSHAAVFPG